MKARVGDGTGMGDVPAEQALQSDQDSKPERGSTGSGDNGTGPELAKGQNRSDK